MEALLTILIALQLGDAWTTYVIVAKQGGTERNDWVGLQQMMNEFGVVPALILYKGLAIVLGIYIAREHNGEYILGALDVFYTWVVWHNYKQMK